MRKWIIGLGGTVAIAAVATALVVLYNKDTALIGNTAGATLGQVLNGPRAVAFREGLDVATNPTCRQCVCSLYVS